MKRIFTYFAMLFALSFVSVDSFADSFELVFKDWDDTTLNKDGKPNNTVGDSSSAYTANTDLSKIFAFGSDYVSSIPNIVNVYPARVDMGAKFGTSNKSGSITINLKTEQEFDKIEFYCSKYNNDESKVLLNGGEAITLTAATGTLETLTINPEGKLSSVTFATTAKRAFLKKIVFYPKGSKSDSSLSFGETTEYTVNIGESFEAPTLTASPSTIASSVTYESSDETVATVSDAGNVTLTGNAGTTTITASFAGNDDYYSSKASYVLNVVDPTIKNATFEFSENKYEWTATNVGGTYFDGSDYNAKEGNVSVGFSGKVRLWESNGNYSMRMYSNDDTYGCGQMTITADKGYIITQVEVKGSTLSFKLPEGAEGSFAAGVWTGEASSVVLQRGTSNSNFTTVNVTYKEQPAAKQYSLVGYINGADYGCQDDYENPGEYIFDAEGKLTVNFEQDSYVFVKTTDNANWYLTQNYVDCGAAGESVSATMVTGKNYAEKMKVPAGTIEITLTEAGDDTVVLSYTMPVPTVNSWTVAGVKELFGGEGWDVNDTDNDMTLDENTGLWTLKKKNVTLEEGTYEYKAAANHAWSISVPNSNATLEITEAGVYNITFTLNSETKELTAVAEKNVCPFALPSVSATTEVITVVFDLESAVEGRENPTLEGTVVVTLNGVDYVSGFGETEVVDGKVSVDMPVYMFYEGIENVLTISAGQEISVSVPEITLYENYSAGGYDETWSGAMEGSVNATVMTTTGVNSFSAANAGRVMFNVAGQRISNAKGVVIVGGKKQMVK